ncbi:MAG: beta-lactamase domain-containing protein [Hyphomonadaceae bacterium]|nr:MAG: beta-lactamase domain-containing protein [Hyphomonadaceae bacterium]KAF0186122.1 MAG: beta-lactamase domain-containing protein [Hyphomonadaceae bacterium]
MSIPFIKTLDFQYGVPAQISPLVRRVIANNPGPFTFFGTGTYIIGHGNVAVIDPGPDDDAHLTALLAATKGETITHIFVTHPHLDHSPLAAKLSAVSGAKTYGKSEKLGHKPIDANTEEGDDDGFRPDIEVNDGEKIACHGFDLEAIFTPGHTGNHVCYALPQENALFSGDHIMGWSTSVIIPPDGDMSDYLDSLDKVAARDFATLYPTHGAPITEPAPFIAAYKQHRVTRENQVIECLRQGTTKIIDMVPILYANVDKRLWPAAARSLHAHLIRLVKIGRAIGGVNLGDNYHLI